MEDEEDDKSTDRGWKVIRVTRKGKVDGQLNPYGGGHRKGRS